MKTKIIATYGPGIERRSVLSKLIKHVNIFRINFSHGSTQTWLSAMENIRKVSQSEGKEISLLADLPGPKIRLGAFDKGIEVRKGETVTFRYGKPAIGKVPLDHDIYPYLTKGSSISIGDGYMSFSIKELRKGDIVCRASNSGTLLSRKGINIRNGNVTAAPPTTEDIKLARFAKKNDFDFIALSFVRSAANISPMRKAIGESFIVAKKERQDAGKNINENAAAADGIMVARGDLAFEIPVEMIPIAQARIIHSSMKHNKPVIVATQMLASMVNSPMPTRAEVNDIAGAVMSGVDCVMLSEETAVGNYPVEAVKTLAATAKNAEEISGRNQSFKVSSISDSIAFAAAEIADNYRTECIFAPTQTGSTAMKLSALRPRSDIIALSRSSKIRRRLGIFYGVHSGEIKRYGSVDKMLRLVRQAAQERGIKKYIVVSGSPNHAGSTNTLQYIE